MWLNESVLWNSNIGNITGVGDVRYPLNPIVSASGVIIFSVSYVTNYSFATSQNTVSSTGASPYILGCSVYRVTPPATAALDVSEYPVGPPSV